MRLARKGFYRFPGIAFSRLKFAFGCGRLVPGDGLKWGRSLLLSHDGIGIGNFFIHPFGGIIEENDYAYDQGQETKPNGPIIFFLPQVGDA